MYTYYRFQAVQSSRVTESDAAKTKPANRVDDFSIPNEMATKANQPTQSNNLATKQPKASKRIGVKTTKRIDVNPVVTGKSVPSLLGERADELSESSASKTKPAYETDVSVNCCANVAIKSDRGGGVASLIPHAKDLRKACLCRSLSHQRKFFAVRSAVLSWVKQNQRHLLKGTGKEGRFFAFLVNNDYAFRHIFKSGGTTVQLQTHKGKRGHVTEWGFGNRSLFTTVRDPLERFLSGWAECGLRHFDAMANLTVSDAYDDRVRAWLQYLLTSKGTSNGRKGKGSKGAGNDKRNLRTCRPHSMPQTNYLWQRDDTFEWHARLDLVGELKELPRLLELIGFPYDDSMSVGNDARESEVKMRHFPRSIDLLSNNTVLDVCKYLALDYYLFDFDPPAPCREMFMENIADMNIVFPY